MTALPQFRFTDANGHKLLVTANTVHAAWCGAAVRASATDVYGRPLRPLWRGSKPVTMEIVG